LIDRRSIHEVQPDDVRDYTQCNFFAGIGGWAYALKLAGWDSTRPVWTASLPCQPLSSAGQQKGEKDERHLWPVFFDLVKECRPAIIFGEQVASKLGREWLSGVFADLETLEYITAAADLPASSVGAPHKRNRLFWVADSSGFRPKRSTAIRKLEGNRRFAVDCQSLDHAVRERRQPEPNKKTLRIQQEMEKSSECRGIIGNSGSNNHWRSVALRCGDGKYRRVPARVADSELRGRTSGQMQDGQRWTGPYPTSCKANHRCGYEYEIEPALFPLADGISNRMGLLRGAGNSIVPQVTAQFVMAFMETEFARDL